LLWKLDKRVWNNLFKQQWVELFWRWHANSDQRR
jgi:hypothetical protein